MTTNEIQELLNRLMRGIDKKTVLTFELRPQSDSPGVLVHLRRDQRTGSLQLTEADLFAAQTDLMRRHSVRTALKRAHDRMWEQTSYIFSTKVDRDQMQGADSFHPARGRGRR